MRHGKLVVNCGSMFSGKSSELIRQGKRYYLAGKTVAYIKPKLDNRYADELIVTHDGTAFPAYLIEDGLELLAEGIKEHDVILIDEVQFLEAAGTILAVNELLAVGVDVIVSGLDMDRHGHPFGVVPYLMAIADEVKKFQAVCSDCGSDAWVSYGGFDEENQVVLGATEKYRPLCRTCFSNRTYGGHQS